MIQNAEEAIKKVQACLLAGAIGDALGAPVEFMSHAGIAERYGSGGIRNFEPAYGVLGAITDDTQMTLFTAEGLLRGVVRTVARANNGGITHIPAVIHHALFRWLITQDFEPGTPKDLTGKRIDRSCGLILDPRLWSRRAPGNTCISSLQDERAEVGKYASNNSKGCGGVMRVAPCAFFGDAFHNASESARMTHGHPTGYLTAGLFAYILQRLFRLDAPDSGALHRIVQDSLENYGDLEGMQETRAAIEQVLHFVDLEIDPTPDHIDEFGGGWVAEEALAIALWCALSASTLEDGIIMSVNHSGDSDSTGSMSGNLLGLMYGLDAIPSRWLQDLEMKDVIETIARDLIEVPRQCVAQGADLDRKILERYPGY